MPLDPESVNEYPDADASASGSNSGVEKADEGDGKKRALNFNVITFLEPLNIQDGAPVTRMLVLLNIVVFALMVADSDFRTLFSPTNELLLEWGANFGPLSLGPEPWRVFTLCFIHIGFMHLFLNMFVLWQFGVPTEKLFGSRSYLLLYLLSGLGGSCTSLLFTPGLVSAGASGAIYGVIGGLVACYVRKRRDIQAEVMKGIYRFVLMLVGITYAMGFMYPLDNAAHFGGMAVGFLSGLAVFPDRTSFIYKIRIVGLALVAALVFGIYKYAQTTPFDTDGSYKVISIEKEIESRSPESALPLAEKFIEKNPDKAFGYRAKGELLRLLGKNSEAIEYFNKAIQVDPEDSSLYIGRSRCLLHAGMYGAALQDGAKARDMGDSHPAIYYVQMMAAGAIGKNEISLDNCRKLLKLGGDSYHGFLVDRSRIYRMMGRNKDALHDLDAVVRANRHPSLIRALESRAYLLYGLGRKEDALRDQKRVESFKTFKSEYEYLNRAYGSLIFNRNQSQNVANFAIDDALSLLNKFSYDHAKREPLVYGTVIGVLEAKRVGDQEALQNMQSKLGKLVTKDFWPYPIVACLTGEISEAQLLKSVEKNKSRLTEAHAFIGFDKEIEGKTDEAARHYQWVLKSGNPFFMEYDLALVRSKMLESRKH